MCSCLDLKPSRTDFFTALGLGYSALAGREREPVIILIHSVLATVLKKISELSRRSDLWISIVSACSSQGIKTIFYVKTLEVYYILDFSLRCLLENMPKEEILSAYLLAKRGKIIQRPVTEREPPSDWIRFQALSEVHL